MFTSFDAPDMRRRAMPRALLPRHSCNEWRVDDAHTEHRRHVVFRHHSVLCIADADARSNTSRDFATLIFIRLDFSHGATNIARRTVTSRQRVVAALAPPVSMPLLISLRVMPRYASADMPCVRYAAYARATRV